MSTPEIQRYLTCLPFFAHLDADATQALGEEMEESHLNAGEVLFSQGEPGDAIYVLLSGKCRVSAYSADEHEVVLNELHAGDCIGEMALLSGQPRSATVTALEGSELLRLRKSAFERLSETYPNLFSGLATQLLPRFQQVYVDLALRRLFGELDDNLRNELLKKLGWRHLEKGKMLFHQGDDGDEMYIVVRGRLQFFLEEPDGNQHQLGEVGAGDCIGEFALLAERGTPESKRTASVYAARSTDMVVLSRPVFEDLLCEYPRVILNLTRQIVRRATSVGKSSPAVEHNIVITLIPIRDGLEMNEFSRQLAESLRMLGTTFSLSAASFEEQYGKREAAQMPLDHPLSLVINAWLDEREAEHNFTVYETSPAIDGEGKLTNWTQRCIEDADLILLIGPAGREASLTPVEKAIISRGTQCRVELVLLHPGDCLVPIGTAAWLKQRRANGFILQAYHHAKMGNQADFRRLARRIVGKSVGLTLSGGGARGWAHVGVVRAMEEAGLEFDWVGGASMGAIVAAGCALDWSSRQMGDMATRFSDPKKLLDYTFPYASITATKRITAILQSQFSGADIEDTWHPFFCISANLNQGEERIHTTGPLWKAVRASMAFPGIFAPVSDEGCVLIDGGAANNLPIDRMREMCPTGTVIGVDLVTGSPIRGEYDFSPSLSGWQALSSRLASASKRKRVPTLLNIIEGLVYSIQRYRLNETWHCADLLIKVPVQNFGLLEFDKYEEIIEAGYQVAREQLKGFKP